MELKKFNKEEALEQFKSGDLNAFLKYDLRGVDLGNEDIAYANLAGMDLSRADLWGVDLDCSCLPLWCGGLGWKIDKRIACQIAYHLCSMECNDPEFIEIYNKIYEFANKFHRAEECGFLEKR